MQERIRVAIYGGAFDPPHVGHVLTTAWLLATNQVDRVWIMPSCNHPFGKDMSPFEVRREMCEKAFEIFEGVQVKPDEQQNPSGLMFDLVYGLRQRYPDNFQFHLVIGADNWEARKRWKKWSQLEKIVEDIIVVGREGSNTAGVLNICNISSSDIRDAFAENNPYVGEDEVFLPHALPAPVLTHILEERMYGCGTKLEEQLEGNI